MPCIAEHPELVAFSRSHAAAGDAAVVSVVFDDTAANVEAFFEENGGDWPVIADDSGRVAVAYGVTGVPESYMVAPSGLGGVEVPGRSHRGRPRLRDRPAHPVMSGRERGRPLPAG